MESTFMCGDQRAVMQLMEEDTRDEHDWGMKHSLTSFSKQHPTPGKRQKLLKPKPFSSRREHIRAKEPDKS
jgi:hypothetical protein